MGIYILLFMVAITGLIFSLIVRGKSKNNFDKKLKENNSNIGMHNVRIRYGLPVQDSFGDIIGTNDGLLLEFNGCKYTIGYEKLTAIEFVTQTDVLTKDKSALARGVGGTILLGPLGGIIGAASGIGQKKEKGMFVVINYQSDNEIKVIILQSISYAKETREFVKAIQEKIQEHNTVKGEIAL